MSLILTAGNTWSTASGDSESLATLNKWLRLWAEMMDPEAGALVDSRGRFLTGLIPLVYACAPEVSVQMRDARSLPFDSATMPDWLRPYQKAAVRAAIESKNGIVKATTGAGKTVIAAGLMFALPVRWVFVVHKPDVVRQAAKSFRKLLNEPVIELAGKDTDWKGRILCATYDQLINNDKAWAWIAEVGGVVVDECHRAATSSAYKCLTHMNSALWRVGMSATPLDRTDMRNLLTVGLLGAIEYEIKAQELIEGGNITPLEISWLPCHHQDAGISPRNWTKFYEHHVVQNETRNQLLVDAIKRCPTPALLFVKRKDHAANLAAKLEAQCPGKSVVCVNGDTPKEARDAIVASVNKKAVDFIVATSVFNEGIDAAEFRSAVIGGSGRSRIEGLQRPGRLTRLADGKQVGKVYDVDDLGLDALDAHTNERYNAYADEGFTVAALAARPVTWVAPADTQRRKHRSTLNMSYEEMFESNLRMVRFLFRQLKWLFPLVALIVFLAS